tara:strand:+ start:1726 stop:1902 length:177 start_codon:yes stop_codon:yes gene_type:complete
LVSLSSLPFELRGGGKQKKTKKKKKKTKKKKKKIFVYSSFNKSPKFFVQFLIVIRRNQ